MRTSMRYSPLPAWGRRLGRQANQASAEIKNLEDSSRVCAMYQQYWGLAESPFRGGLELDSFYPTPSHEEALARLNFLVEERRRLGMLCGPVGIGKSLLLEIFARQMNRAGADVVRANLVGADAHEFLWTVAAQCGLNPALAATQFALWRRLADRLIECRYQRSQLVMLLDDVEAAERGVFEL